VVRSEGERDFVGVLLHFSGFFYRPPGLPGFLCRPSPLALASRVSSSIPRPLAGLENYSPLLLDRLLVAPSSPFSSGARGAAGPATFLTYSDNPFSEVFLSEFMPGSDVRAIIFLILRALSQRGGLCRRWNKLLRADPPLRPITFWPACLSVRVFVVDSRLKLRSPELGGCIRRLKNLPSRPGGCRRIHAAGTPPFLSVFRQLFFASL